MGREHQLVGGFSPEGSPEARSPLYFTTGVFYRDSVKIRFENREFGSFII